MVKRKRRKKNSGFVAGVVQGIGTFFSGLSTAILGFIGGVGLFVALAVQLTISVISMQSMVSGDLEKIMFTGIAIVLVLFSARGWQRFIKYRGVVNFALGLSFAIAGWFLNVSVALIATKTQDQVVETVSVTEDTDPELRELRRQRTEAKTTLDQLNADFAISGRDTTIDSVLGSRALQQQKIDDLDSKILLRLGQIGSGILTDAARRAASVYSSRAIFQALPDAVTEGRGIPLTIFSIIFLGLELTVVVGIASTESREEGASIREVSTKEDYLNTKITDYGMLVYPQMNEDNSIPGWHKLDKEGCRLNFREFQAVTALARNKGLLEIKDKKIYLLSSISEFFRSMKVV